MCLKTLSLYGFRSYKATYVTFDTAKPTILIGPNGSGKTNFLEALSLLMLGKGLRAAPYAEMGRQWQIQACLDTLQGEVRIVTAFDAEKNKRHTQINEHTLKNSASINNYLHALWLTPENTFWFSLAHRRAFLDKLVSGFSPEHAYHSYAYEKLMRERNRLLLYESTTPAHKHWLTHIEEKMSQEGLAIAHARCHFLQALAHQEIKEFFLQPKLKIIGLLEDALQENSTVEVEALLKKTLFSNRDHDKKVGRTTQGPHTSRFLLFFPTKNIEGRFCSTGEQKLMLLALVLRYAHFFSTHSKAVLLLLLDEIVAHLDHHHRKILFETLLSGPWQSFMTGTDRAPFEPMESYAYILKAEEGELSKLD